MPRKVIQKDYKKLSSNVYDFYDLNHRMPSYNELTDIFGVSSKDTVSRIVSTLVSLGFITQDSNGRLLPIIDKFKSQNFKPKKHYSVLRMLGLVEAGFPSFVDVEDTETISLDDWIVADKTATFMLKVKGESMIDAGIMDGDYVIVERGRDPKNNDIVLANVDGGWTLKYYIKDKTGISLEPANKRFKTIRAKQDLEIPAVVISVIRKYGK
jgi:repressor LexA